jgi:cytochrome c5
MIGSFEKQYLIFMFRLVFTGRPLPFWGEVKLLSLFLGFFFYTISSLAATHQPQVFLDKIKGTSEEGAQIVSHFCSSCHAIKPIIPLGAPRINNAEDWKLRVDQGLKTLLKHLEEGLGAMPARGGCFECSDEQLFLAVLAMLPETQKKMLQSDLRDHKKSTK